MDVLQMIGLEYAKHQEIWYGLPLAIAMVAGGFFYKVSNSGGSTLGYLIVGGLALGVFFQVPAMIAKAKSDCRTQLSARIPDDFEEAHLCREQFPELDRKYPSRFPEPGRSAQWSSQLGRRPLWASRGQDAGDCFAPGAVARASRMLATASGKSRSE